MGTNYYLYGQPCPHCGRRDERLHIGKSSAGWCFGLHVDDERKSLADWERAWADPAASIRDEYGDSVTPEDMRRVITERSRHPKARPWTELEYCQNSARPGPNGLVRHIVDGRHCIGHGEGTWDLITGEFS